MGEIEHYMQKCSELSEKNRQLEARVERLRKALQTEASFYEQIPYISKNFHRGELNKAFARVNAAISDTQGGAPTNVVPRDTRIADLLAEDPRVLLAILDGLTDDQRKRLHTALSEPDRSPIPRCATCPQPLLSDECIPCMADVAPTEPDGGAGLMMAVVEAAVADVAFFLGESLPDLKARELMPTYRRMVLAVRALKGHQWYRRMLAMENGDEAVAAYKAQDGG